MIDGSFSLFGFDLLGPSRRASREGDRKRANGKPADSGRKSGEDGVNLHADYSTTLLWTMYTHY